MTADNPLMLASAIRMANAAEVLAADIVAKSNTDLLYRAYGDDRLDAAPPIGIPVADQDGYVRPTVDVLNDTHLEDSTGVVDVAITAEETDGTTWFEACTPSAWDTAVLRIPIMRYAGSTSYPNSPDLGGGGGTPPGPVIYPDWASGIEVLSGEIRAYTIMGVSINMRSSTDRTTGTAGLTELSFWSLVSQAEIEAYVGGVLVLEDFKILEGAVTWQCDETRISRPLFDATEKTRWTEL